jgi:hypothetical protein
MWQQFVDAGGRVHLHAKRDVGDVRGGAYHVRPAGHRKREEAGDVFAGFVAADKRRRTAFTGAWRIRRFGR